MNVRQMSMTTCNEKTADLSTSVVGGFYYFQSTLCGYTSCACPSPHYHCQNCGFGTSELPNAVIHKEACPRFLRGRFSQSPSQQQLTSTQASERPLTCPSYDPGPDSTMSTMSISSLQSSMQITNTGNHLYYRGGSRQSSVFSPLLSGQNQPLYSGVFGSQVGFTGQNNYPSTFNSYSHVEPPPWLSDSRMSSSTSSTPNLDSGRASKTLSCGSQGVSHSCCGSRVGLLENVGLCSPSSSDIYKPLSKETGNCQQKNSVNMENQNLFCGQSVLGYNSPNIQNSVYKFPEPFPSCTMSQLGIPLNEQGDVKHTGISCESNSISKQSMPYCNSVRKSSPVEMNKDQSTKYCSTHINGQVLDNISSCIQQKMLESGSYDNHHILFDSDMQDDMYSQGSMVLSDERIASLPYISRTSFFQTNVSDTGKNFSSQQCQTSSLSRCGLIACEVLEGCLQLEGQPLYQYSNLPAVSSNTDDDRVSNHGSCSGAAESDIIVEESEEEEVVESEVSVEDEKNNSETSCLVCSSSNAYFVRVSVISPVTSTSHIPVATKLAEVVASDCPPSMSFHNEIICKRCLNLVEAVDSLENKLASVKQNLIELYRSRMKLIKFSEVPAEEGCQTSTCVNFGTAPKSDSESKMEKKDICSVKQKEPVKSDICITTPANDTGKDDCPEVGVDLESSLCLERSEIVNQNSDGECISNICTKRLPNKDCLEKQMQQHTKAFRFICDCCGQGFMLRAGLEKHLMDHAAEYRFQCEVCGKCFVQYEVLKDHLQRHCDSFRLSCSHCEKGFMYASSLKVHERIHTGERPYVCQHCGKSFICASNLTAHIRVCSGQQHFSCGNCDKKFSTSLQLKTHSITRHNASPPLKCEICGKCFIKACDLKVHSRSHSGEKPHPCEVCGKCYSSVGNLNQHAKKHCTERPFKCDLCGKGFLRKSILERHMNQHIGNRPYKCNVCNKGFVSTRDLHTHNKLHSGKMKKYTCPVCGKVMNNGLKVHMRTHSGDRPYKCSECVLSFSVKSTLDKHMRLKHRCST